MRQNKRARAGMLARVFIPDRTHAMTQIIVAAVFWTVMSLWSLRWRSEDRLFVIGLAVLTFAWFGARAIH